MTRAAPARGERTQAALCRPRRYPRRRPRLTSLCGVTFDIGSLSHLWQQSWPSTRPLGHEVRANRERWVRFHALPKSKRYPEDEQEYAEVLRRHNLLLSELTARTSTSLLVLTMAWSASAVPIARDEAVARALPDASFWTSVNQGDDDYPSWTHVYVTPVNWRTGALDPLLRLVADDGTDGVVITDDLLSWLVHPYDGGVDVVTRLTEDRDALRAQHSDWLSSHPGGL